jgi:hypothetical protein
VALGLETPASDDSDYENSEQHDAHSEHQHPVFEAYLFPTTRQVFVQSFVSYKRIRA